MPHIYDITPMRFHEMKGSIFSDQFLETASEYQMLLIVGMQIYFLA